MSTWETDRRARLCSIYEDLRGSKITGALAAPLAQVSGVRCQVSDQPMDADPSSLSTGKILAIRELGAYLDLTELTEDRIDLSRLSKRPL